MTPTMRFYMQQLRRKQAQLENDRERVRRLLARPVPNDFPTHQRLKRELEDIEIRLAKLRRGLLYG